MTFLTNCWRYGVVLGVAAALLAGRTARAELLGTFITGDHAGDPAIFRAIFDPAVKDSAVLTIAVTDPVLGAIGGRLDNIDFVPGSSFQRVVATSQFGIPSNGGLEHYNVLTGTKLTPFVASTNAIASPPASGMSRPASIVPNAAGTHFYYVENQFGFAGSTHRLVRAPIAGGAEQVVYDGGTTLVEFSGVEIVNVAGTDRLYFFAHDTAGPADERQLYSVALDGAGLGTGAAVLHVAGLDRSGAGGPGPFSSDGSDELDYDPVSGRLYGTNIGTGEMIGYVPGSGPFTSPALLPFFISGAAIAAAAAIDTEDGLGLLSGVVTPDPGAPNGESHIDGVRPDGTGAYLIVVGHDGVLVSIDVAGVMAGLDNLDIIRLFNKAVPTAGTSAGLNRASIGFDDHTILAPAAALVPEPSTVAIWLIGAGAIAILVAWRRNVSAC